MPDLKNIYSVDEIKNRISRNGIHTINHHECGICGCPVCYVIENGNVYFDSTCDCSHGQSPLRPRTWDDLADFIHQHTPEEVEKLIGK